MKTELLQTRKFDGEEYKFFINYPEYSGEKGVCGVEIEPYIEVETPPNSFGYPDTVLLGEKAIYTSNGYFIKHEKFAYTLHRYLPRWILKKLEKQMIDALNKWLIERSEKYEESILG